MQILHGKMYDVIDRLYLCSLYWTVNFLRARILKLQWSTEALRINIPGRRPLPLPVRGRGETWLGVAAGTFFLAVAAEAHGVG